MDNGEDTAAPGTLLLSGVVGSQAYGLAHAGSDTDRLGVFAFDTDRWWDLLPPVSKDMTVARTAPDLTLHEAYKYAWLCLKANPSATELLWLPEHRYEHRHRLGDHLIGIRRAFLCASRVREAYCGYAARQLAELLGDQPVARVEKHARHMLRLLDQGLEFYRTGTLTVEVADPYRYLEFGQRVAAGDIALAQDELHAFAEQFAGARTALPDTPDEAAVGRWLAEVRRSFLPLAVLAA